jgi:hypothetical protein
MNRLFKVQGATFNVQGSIQLRSAERNFSNVECGLRNAESSEMRNAEWRVLNEE